MSMQRLLPVSMSIRSVAMLSALAFFALALLHVTHIMQPSH
jgi:hypothetical protein